MHCLEFVTCDSQFVVNGPLLLLEKEYWIPVPLVMFSVRCILHLVDLVLDY